MAEYMANNIRTRNILGIVVVAFMAAAVSGQAPTIKLTLVPEVSHVTSGDQIRLTITETNVGAPPVLTGNLDLDGTHAENTYRGIIVIGPKGQLAPLTAYGQMWKHSILTGSGGILPTLKTGKSISETLMLSKLFDLTVPGTYMVSVSTRIAKSNDIKVTVEQ